MGRCFYCGVHMRPKGTKVQSGRLHPAALTIDHVVPASKLVRSLYPATLEWRSLNKVWACFSCNNRKGNMWPLDWLEIMPDYGVIRFQALLLLLGCEAGPINAAMASRSQKVMETEGDRQ